MPNISPQMARRFELRRKRRSRAEQRTESRQSFFAVGARLDVALDALTLGRIEDTVGKVAQHLEGDVILGFAHFFSASTRRRRARCS